MKTFKSILRVIFPFYDMFKRFKSDLSELKGFDFWDSDIGWTLKLYVLTTVIPICGTVMIFLMTILGQSMKYSFFRGIWEIWSGFYVTGTFLDIAAWRWQILLLVVAFFFTITQKD